MCDGGGTYYGEGTYYGDANINKFYGDRAQILINSMGTNGAK